MSDATLYLADICPQLYSNERIQKIMEQLKTFPMFVILDSFRSAAADLIPDYMHQIAQRRREPCVQAVVQQMKEHS